MALTTTKDNERGQATILMLGMVGLVFAAMIGLAMVGQAMVHRSRARNGADAVALAAATTADGAGADALIHWYGNRGVVVERVGSETGAVHTVARSGPAQAAAWASNQPSSTQPAPALVAILARAEQLLDTTFVSIKWEPTALIISLSEAPMLRQVAHELGLCELSSTADVLHEVRFEMC